MADDSVVTAFLTGIPLAFLAAALASWTTHGLRHRYTILPTLIAVVSGALVLFWKSLVPSLGIILAPVASNPWVWIGGIAAVWLYLAVYTVVLAIQRDHWAEVVEKDIIPFRLALQKWVMPRQLTKPQMEGLRAYLARFPPGMVTFRQPPHDSEAESYRGEFHRVLNEAGWTVNVVTDAADVGAGLRIHATYTQETMQRREDPRQPKPDRLLYDAFKQAGIQVDGSGSGSGQNVVKDEVFIDVGTRQRDLRNAPTQPWPF